KTQCFIMFSPEEARTKPCKGKCAFKIKRKYNPMTATTHCLSLQLFVRALIWFYAHRGACKVQTHVEDVNMDYEYHNKGKGQEDSGT
ncbi:hypothetical protein ACJX0J_023000, partial [Zea mays]